MLLINSVCGYNESINDPDSITTTDNFVSKWVDTLGFTVSQNKSLLNDFGGGLISFFVYSLIFLLILYIFKRVFMG